CLPADSRAFRHLCAKALTDPITENILFSVIEATEEQDTCDRNHRYTVEDEAQQEVLYTGAGRDEAISALVTLRAAGECGWVVAGHTFDGSYCYDESSLLEDEVIKTWDAARMARRAADPANPEG